MSAMDDLAKCIAAYIRSEEPTIPEFENLALRLFARQYDRIEPYRRLCDLSGAVPGRITSWSQIPAVPVSAFKVFTLSCTGPDQAAAVFHSSGTTSAQTSRHYMDEVALGLYDTSLSAGFDNSIPDRPPTIWALMPPPAEAPNSSLSYMLARLGAARFFSGGSRNLAAAINDLTGPIALFGTAFAFADLFDAEHGFARLPPGSLIVETGGFKGRRRELPRDQLYGLFESRLGVAPERCYSEYGMCEMASQFYSAGLSPVKRAPHWVRTRVVDPETGTDSAPGQPGVLCHYDLANYNSVLAIATQDLGRSCGEGFELLGRAPGSELRGCSLTTEEMWSRTPE
jgi:hypothetical protein